MRVLLTGFEPFGGLTINPSQVIVEHAARKYARRDGIKLLTDVLPTRYHEAGERIRRLIHEALPDAVVALGVAADADAVLLERFAVNIDDCASPDNAGERRAGQAIVLDGPPAYRSTLPLRDIRACLARHGVTSVFSNHAGAFVCNHVFYVACHEIALLRRSIRCGFIHVPLSAAGRTTDGDEQATASLMPVVDCGIEALWSG